MKLEMSAASIPNKDRDDHKEEKLCIDTGIHVVVHNGPRH
jgi:hypothetical protein